MEETIPIKSFVGDALHLTSILKCKTKHVCQIILFLGSQSQNAKLLRQQFHPKSSRFAIINFFIHVEM